MQKFGEFVCKNKIIILIIAIVLLVPSIIGMKATRVNYDILTYLPDNVETIQGQNILKDDFGMGSFSMIIVEDMDSKDILKLEDKIRELDNVKNVVSAADLTGTSIPVDAIPSELKDKIYKGNDTIILATFKDAISSDATFETIDQLRKITNEQCKISGMSATLVDTKTLSDSEVLIYVLIAVALCLIILQLALNSYFAPFLLLLNIGFAILYNMGTNIWLGEISYITKAISAVLQLGVTMDFAIFLYHSYLEEKETHKDNNEAMSIAIAKTMTSVFGSATTTIAGFLALCSMELTLGRDIGIVMAKGVLFGLLCVITVLPALLLVFDKWIVKTEHKTVLPQFKHWKDFNIKHYKAIIVAFLVMMPFAVLGYNNYKVYYKLDSSLPDSLASVSANNELKDKFNVVTTEMILVDKDMPAYQVNNMLKEIDNLDGITSTIGYSKLLGTSVPVDMLPDEIKDVFTSDKYQLIIVSSDYEIATDELNTQISQINEIIKRYDQNAILAGEGPLMNDLVTISNHDFNSVNWVSMGVIFIIMFFVLRSISLPFILMLTIEFAIMINMGIPAYTGTTIPFVASIVIGTIQLGATIDYAILITTKYITERKKGKNKHEAIDYSLGSSINSIVVSALCFFGATFGVGVYSKIEMISSLCTLMARGALISMVTVIMILPALLLLFDKIICKTTLKMNAIKN